METAWLKTVYVLFFIELSTRRVYLAGCTTLSYGAWVTQQARQLVGQLPDQPQPKRFLIHNHDSKFSTAFDHVFTSEGVEIVLTPYQAPKASLGANGSNGVSRPSAHLERAAFEADPDRVCDVL